MSFKSGVLSELNRFIQFYWVSVVTFVTLLVITFYAYNTSKKAEQRYLKELFNLRSADARSAIEKRFGHYIQILRGAKGFFNASDSVTRAEWKNYFNDIEVKQHYPGIQGMGYGKVLFPENLAAYTSRIRKEGFLDFNVFPEGRRDVYVVVQYVAPFNRVNREFLGYDMYSDSVRKKAIDIAWTKNEPALSGRILLEDNQGKMQPGFILYYPIFNESPEKLSSEERLRELKGLVYNPFRAYELMEAILGDEFKKIDIEIYDGTGRSEGKLLFDRYPDVKYSTDFPETLYKKELLRMANQTWSIYYTSLPGFGNYSSYAYGILISGLLISLLVFLVMIFFSNVRQAQDEVMKNLERTRFLTDAMPQIVWQADSSGKVTYVNDQFMEFTGKSFDQFTESLWMQIIYPDDLERTLSIWNESLRTGVNYQLEHRFCRHDGHYRWFLTRGIAQKNETGEIVMWVGTSTEIHEQKNQRESLQKVNEDLDNFIYTASHDLKEPVANIEGLVYNLKDLMNEGNFTEENSKELIGLMETSIQRFQNTLGYLTEINKIQRKLKGDIKEVSIDQLTKDIIAEINPLIEENKAVVKTDLKCGRLRFSVSNLRTVIFNLLTNAVLYKSPDRTPVVELKCYRTSEYFILEVKDNGLGIKPDQQEKIFHMFKRAHGHIEGTGVGLYLVKQIVDNSRGKIEVESIEGKGSTFRLYLKNE